VLTSAAVEEYLAEIREQVCSRCVERPPGGPPCASRGKSCGVELHLREYISAIKETHSPSIEPYLNSIHDRICAHCDRKGAEGCPCPLDYLLVLLVQAIETVDRDHCCGCCHEAGSAQQLSEVCTGASAVCGGRH